jgi:hypothetical protein
MSIIRFVRRWSMLIFVSLSYFPSAGFAEKEGRMSFSGVLHLDFVAASMSETFAMEYRFEPMRWEMVFRPSSGEGDRELFGSEEEALFVLHFPDNLPDGPRNTAQLILYDGSRIFDRREAEHVWLALSSAEIFSARELPFIDPYGLCMREPSRIVEMEFRDNAMSPEHLVWINERSRSDDGEARAPRIQGIFRWLDSAHTESGRVYPRHSELLVSLFDDEGVESIMTRSLLSIEAAEAADDAEIEVRRMPVLAGRQTVYDHRFGETNSRLFVRYNVFDGEIPGRDSVIVQAAIAAQVPDVVPVPMTEERRWIVLFVLIAVAIGVPVILVIISGGRNSNKERSC